VAPYHLLNQRPKEFERLVRRLVAADPKLRAVTLYGLNGQKQFGIDVLADRAGGSGQDVVSCKCVETASAPDLRTWSDDFLKHRAAQWPTVKRFVLATSALNTADTKLVDQRIAEAHKFAQVGIDYEIWGPEDLTQWLEAAGRPVAVQYLGEAWATSIFGPGDAAAHPSASDVQHVASLQGLLSDHADARLIRAAEQLRAGDLDDVEALVAELRAGPQWSQLRATSQARVLRTAASSALARGNLEAAKVEGAAAAELDPTERRVLAAIAQREVGSEAALHALGDGVTRQDRQMRVALLLDSGRAPDAADGLDTLLADDPHDPETLRLVAHLRLTENRRNEAREAAELAFALAPRNLLIARALAITRYADAMSPLAPAVVTSHPIPGDPDLTRTDDAARSSLEAALDIFGRLAARETPDLGDRLWRLACLCNLEGRRDDATAACQGILADEPAQPLAIYWAMGRRLVFDPDQAEAALAALYDAGEASANQVRVFGMLFGARHGAPAATARLEAGLSVQTGEAAEAAELWVGTGAPPSADPDMPAPAEVDAALDAAITGGDWTAVDDYLQRLLGGDVPHVMGLELASAAAEHRRWRTLAPYAEALGRFETARAVRLALFALHHAGTAEAVLDFAARHLQAFPHAQLPLDCRRMVMMAKERVDDLPGALQMAEALVAETGAISDRLYLADIHIQAAHVQAALPAIRMALDAKDLTADRALRYAMAVTRDDAALARDLWRFGLAQGVPDHLLLHALSQGYKLGLNAEAETLMPRVQARAASGAGDVWMVDLDDVVQEMVARRDRSNNLVELLAAGAMPIHLLASALNISLANLYWLLPRTKEKGALSPLFLRHGARPADPEAGHPWLNWRLHLDITGLLIADQLDLWPHLDALQAPVMVSRSLTEAILRLEHDASHHQISQVTIAQALLDALRDQRLRLESGPASEAETVRHQRPDDGEESPGPTVASVLRALGRGEAGPALTELEILPAARARLLFIDNTLETLAMDDVLDQALDQFACEIPQAAIDEATETVRAARTRETLADWIGQVKVKLAQRLESGRFAYVARRLREDDTDTEDADQATPPSKARRPDFVEQSLMDLLAAPGGTTSVLWVDDRHVTGYPMAENKAVVGVVEVLDALRAAERLSAEEHRRKLSQLRAAGAVFLPMRADEVLGPLAAADIRDGAVVETDDLVILRRNLAAAMRLDNKLKLGPSDIPNLEGRPDETPFMLASRRIVHQCLVAMWEDPTAPLDVVKARSDWLWLALRQEQPLRVLPGGDDSGRLLAALNIAALIAAVPHVGSGSWKQALPRRRAMMDWLTATAIEPRADGESDGFLDLVASHIATLANNSDAAEVSAKLDLDVAAAEQYFGLYRRRLFDLLPAVLQERLVTNPDFLANTGIGSISLLTLNGVSFQTQALWAAVTRALRNGTARVRSHAGAMLTLRRVESGLTLKGALDLRIREPWFPVLAAPAEDRADSSYAYLAKLDLPPDDLMRLAAAAAAAKSDSDLVELLQKARAASVVEHYAQMSDRLSGNGDFDQRAFQPPPATALLHHLRLTDLGRPVADQATEAWRSLAAAVGPDRALRRLGGLPIPLAADMHRTIEALETLREPHSPPARLHVAAAARLKGDAEAAERLMRGTVAAMGASGHLFGVLLRWCARAFNLDSSWRALPAGHQLALVWSHAHRVMTIVLERGGVVEPVAEYFERSPLPQDMAVGLWRSPSFEGDCAAPDQVMSSSLIYGGLGYVYGKSDIAEVAPDLAADLPAVFFVEHEGALVLQAGLVLSNPEAANAMGSFLLDRPVGALPPDVDPIEERRSKLVDAIETLERQPTDVLVWGALGRFGKTGMPEALQERLSAVFETVDLQTITGPAEDLHGAAVAIDTRLSVGGSPPDGLIDGKIYRLAQHYAEALRGPFKYQEADNRALTSLVEAAARAAMGPDLQANLERLSGLLLAIAEGWPAAAPPLREICDAYARSMSPEGGAPLWRAFVGLRAWP
jgi:hypothetical protein